MTSRNNGLEKNIDRILFTQDQIAKTVSKLGAAIQEDYASRRPLLIGVLNGCFLFLSDLVRTINLDLEVDFMSVSSYGKGTQSSGAVKILKDLDHDIQNRHVILVEDIIDSGLTATYLLDNLKNRRPASVEFCALLDKKEARSKEIFLKYTGFECPNEFVVGYGLDYKGLYRNLPFICLLKNEIYPDS